MEKKYIPLLYIILYRMIKDSAKNNKIEIGQLKFVLGRHHIKHCYHAVVIKELVTIGLLEPFSCKTASSIVVRDLKEDKFLDNTSKLYKYVGCY